LAIVPERHEAIAVLGAGEPPSRSRPPANWSRRSAL